MYVNPELGLCIGALTLKARLLVDVPSNMQDTQVYPSMFSRVTNTCPCDAIVSFTLTLLWDIECYIARTVTFTAILVDSPNTFLYHTSSLLFSSGLNEAIAHAAGLLVLMLVTATIFFPSGISKSKITCAYGVDPDGKEIFSFVADIRDIELLHYVIE